MRLNSVIEHSYYASFSIWTILYFNVGCLYYIIVYLCKMWALLIALHGAFHIFFSYTYCLNSVQFDMLELDRFAKPLVTCPLLLDPASYFPDTEDLTQNQEAREYWLQCFEEATGKVIVRQGFFT